MVEIYCADHHRRGGAPCAECGEFLDYAERRLEKCPYGEGKPTCAKCPIHCYKPAQREQAREIMRYAGPRMMLRHPWLSLTHLLDKLRRVEHPMEMRGGASAPESVAFRRRAVLAVVERRRSITWSFRKPFCGRHSSARACGAAPRRPRRRRGGRAARR